MKNKKSRKVLKIIKNVANVIVVVFVLAFVLIVCLQRFSGNKISFFDYRMFNVVTGSMAPKYNVGDVLISKEVQPKNIKVGDTISYLGAIGQFKDKVITHEVVDIEKDTQGKYVFHAKGLANLVEDPNVSEDQLYGVVIYKSRILSFIYKVVGTTMGMFIFIIIPILYIVCSEMIAMMIEKKEQMLNKN